MLKKVFSVVAMLALLSGHSSAQTLSQTDLERIKNISVRLNRIVFDNWSKTYKYPITQVQVPADLCTTFYNDLVGFNNTILTDWTRKYPDASISLPGKVLEKAYFSALSMASACNYDDSLKMFKFEIYNELYESNMNLLNLILSGK